MILGLDISTSITGWCILSEEGDFIDMGFVNFNSKLTPFKKADLFGEHLEKICKKYKISEVFVEENLQKFRPGFSSAKTLITLARFIGIISYLSYRIFDLEPVYINVNEARKSLGIKILREKICGKTTKEQVMEWVGPELEGCYTWPVKKLKSGPRKDQIILHPGCADAADAYVIARAGIVNN